MKIDLICMRCSLTESSSAEIVLDILDSGIYEFTCANGHKNIVALQEMKFELLSDVGKNAIVDGYYREAVSAFNACLERFYEFYIKVVCESKNITDEKFNKAWKYISNQSERQVGAFAFLFLLDNSKTATLLDNFNMNCGKYSGKSCVSFRNAVIHKGYFPTKSEAIDFCQTIINIILDVASKLKANHDEHMNIIVNKHILETNAQNTSPTRAYMSMGTIINISRLNGEGTYSINLDEVITEIINRRR